MKICIPLEAPQAVEDKINMIKGMLTESSAGKGLEDLYKASRSIYLSIVMSVVYSIAFIYFLSIFGETLAWICVFILELLFITAAGATYLLW